MRLMIPLFVFGLFAIQYGPAKAWGGLAHTAVCEVAFQELKGNARNEVKRLIRLDDEFRTFAQSCVWPDRPRKRGSEHFVNLERDSVGLTEANKCPMADKCVVTAIEEDLAILKNPNSSDAEKLDALKYLGHWVGDIHQPLHVSFRDDRGGNSINESGPCKKSLHAVWDTCIFEERFSTDALEAGMDFQASVTPDQREAWVASGPVDWANESFKILRLESVEYCVMVGDECRYEEGNPTLDGHEQEKTVVVNSDYITTHAPIIEERIKMAGVRLGFLINEAFNQ